MTQNRGSDTSEPFCLQNPCFCYSRRVTLCFYISNTTFIYMAKNITKKIKIRAMGGMATPAPPLGPALGQAGVNIGDFVQKFNAATADKRGETLGVKIDVYDDRTYDFRVTEPTMTSLIFKAAGIEKGSSKARTSKVGKLTRDQVRAIAERKMPDLNANDIDAAMKIVEGSARSAGIEVVG